MNQGKDIYSLANHGINFADKISSNLQFIELYFSSNRHLSIEIEENSIKDSEIGTDIGTSVRVVDNKGSLGFAFTNRLEKNYFEAMIKSSIKMMEHGTEDPDYKTFPSTYPKYGNIKGLYDKNLKDISIEESIPYVEDLIRICDNDDMAVSQSAGFSSNFYKTYIFNSNGLNTSDKESVCSVSSHIIVKDDNTNDTSSGFEYQTERSLININAENVILTALKDAKRNLNRIKIKNGKVPIILTPRGTINMILKPLASAINGESFQYKRTFLVGKKGECIGTELLNIEDNALLDGAVGSSIFDGEGVPCKNKVIVEKGKFLTTGLLHNTYTAGKEGVKSTGNASRNSYRSLPSIGISNFMLKPGSESQIDMIKDVKEGILFNYTGDRPNTSTGDFSGLILHGNLIKNGEVKEPLNETMFGINLLEMFKKIEGISKESKTYGPYHAPYVKIGEVQIIGASN